MQDTPEGDRRNMWDAGDQRSVGHMHDMHLALVPGPAIQILWFTAWADDMVHLSTGGLWGQIGSVGGTY